MNSGTLLVVTGHRWNGPTNNTLLVDPNSNSSPCENWNNYPLALYSATGSIVSGSPIVCGGLSNTNWGR